MIESYQLRPNRWVFTNKSLRMSDDNPSDTDVNDVNVLEEKLTNKGSSFAKDILLTESDKSLSRIEIAEYVLLLEKSFSSPSPAESKLLNGVWEVVVSGFGSPGLVAYQAVKALPGQIVELSDLTVTISSVQPRVTTTANVKAGPLSLDLSVITDLETESDIKIKESYVSGKINSIDIPISSITSYSRELLVTYLDDDLLIVRDCFGSPEVLRRKNILATRPGSEGAPSVGDDAPGA
eukprot:gene21619-27982_t